MRDEWSQEGGDMEGVVTWLVEEKDYLREYKDVVQEQKKLKDNVCGTEFGHLRQTIALYPAVSVTDSRRILTEVY